jgi:cell division topological specificity factor
MSWLDIFRGRRPQASAASAKERLQIVLSHERISREGDDFLPKLQRDLVEVVARYVNVDAEKVNVSLERGADLSTLASEIELPGPQTLKRAS